jgi:ABC-type transporter Mla MlaB component
MDKLKHKVEGNKLTIELLTNRFTHDLVHAIRNDYPATLLNDYTIVEFNLRQVKMIDSGSIGFLFETHNKLKAKDPASELIIAVGDNKDLKELLHKFQVDLMLTVK